MGERRDTKVYACLALALVMLVALPAASAVASVKVRLVDARGGANPVRLSVSVGVEQNSARAGWGQASDFVVVPPGDAELALSGGSGKPARARKQLADGASYTVVALP